jgi:hypothetical protein
MVQTVIKLMTLAAVALHVTSQACAGLVVINFDDGGNNSGSGATDVEDGYAISGNFIMTVGLAAGDWTLTGGTPSSPGSGSSPSGFFKYDNMVNLGSDPFLTTTGGLLFTDSNGDQLNIWAARPGTYDLWAVNSAGVYYVEAGAYPGYPDATSSGTVTVTAVPEPVNYALTGFGLILVGASLRRLYVSYPRSTMKRQHQPQLRQD